MHRLHSFTCTIETILLHLFLLQSITWLRFVCSCSFSGQWPLRVITLAYVILWCSLSPFLVLFFNCSFSFFLPFPFAVCTLNCGINCVPAHWMSCHRWTVENGSEECVQDSANFRREMRKKEKTAMISEEEEEEEEAKRAKTSASEGSTHTHTQFNAQTIVPANAGASNVQTTQLTIAARLSCSVYLPVVDCRSVICRWPVYGKVSFQTWQTEPAEQSEQMSIWMWERGQADNLCFLMFDHPASVQRGERGKWLSHWLLCFACSFTAITTHHTDHHHRRCSFHFISFIH